VSRRLQLALAPAIALLVVALTAVPNVAASGRAKLTEAGGAEFPNRAYVVTLPTERALTGSQVVVRENGKRVRNVTVTPAAAAATNQFGVVLVIDASDSMKGRPIVGALEAARLFVAHRAPTQQVAVITFNDQPSLALPFTTDGGKITQALEATPQLAYGTHLYDAVSEAISQLHDAEISAGSVVLLSDGADTHSEVSPAAVVDAARKAHVRLFTVGLRSRHFDPKALEELAASGSGQYSEANSVDDLLGIYDQLGTQLSHEYLLRYQSLAGLGAKVKVKVKVAGEPGALSGGYATSPIQTSPPPSAFHKGLSAGFWLSPFTMIVFSIFAVALLAFCVGALLVPRRRSVQKRLAEFVSLETSESARGGHLVPTAVFDSTESSLEKSARWQRFKEECEIGEIELSPTHIAIWTLVGTIAFMWAVAVLFSFAAILLAVFIPMAVWGYVHRKAERKRARFAEQLPDNLAVLASALRAGHSLVGALSVVVDDAAEPGKSEFQRVVADEQLGRPLDEALESVVERMQNKDLAQVALVAALQRETGGSTAEVLDRVVETVRDRQDLRRLVKTLTAAGRMSRWVVSLLPVALILAILVLSPGYLKPLFAHTSGRVLFVFAAVLVISGSLVIKRIVDIKV